MVAEEELNRRRPRGGERRREPPKSRTGKEGGREGQVPARETGAVITNVSLKRVLLIGREREERREKTDKERGCSCFQDKDDSIRLFFSLPFLFWLK